MSYDRACTNLLSSTGTVSADSHLGDYMEALSCYRATLEEDLRGLTARYGPDNNYRVQDSRNLLTKMDSQLRLFADYQNRAPSRVDYIDQEEQLSVEKHVFDCQDVEMSDKAEQQTLKDVPAADDKKNELIVEGFNELSLRIDRRHGIRVKDVTADTWTVELTVHLPSSTCSQTAPDGHMSTTGHGSEMSLEVTIKFRNQTSSPDISDVKVSESNIVIDDIVTEAKKTHNAHELLTNLYDRWFKYCTLNAEIEPLRHRYALDWIQPEGIIRVLYGGLTSTTCSLKLDESYPLSGTGGILLESVSELPPDVTLDSLQIPRTATLEESLEFLKSKLLPSGGHSDS